MRAIEAWLAKTGWGSDDTAARLDQSSGGDSEDDGSSGRGSDDESDRSSRTADSEQGDHSDHYADAENSSDEENEETIEGEFGFGCY